jgi:hypothetical protein
MFLFLFNRNFTANFDACPGCPATVAIAKTSARAGSFKTETTGNYSHGILVHVKVLCDLCFPLMNSLQMERETRVRQQENSTGSQQQPEFAMRRNPLHTHSSSNSAAANELSSNTVDPFLSAASAAATVAVPHTCVNGTGNGAATNIPQSSTAPPSSLATDFHARQESADSGLGMGGSYSLPHTPEDFLASMDDTMDTTLDCNFDFLN